MKLSVGLTENQMDHLREIKATHGISMSAFIRVLLKRDMEKALVPEYAIVDERSEVTTTKTRRRVAIHRGPVSPARAALMKELSTVIARRREKVEQAIMASSIQA